METHKRTPAARNTWKTKRTPAARTSREINQRQKHLRKNKKGTSGQKILEKQNRTAVTRTSWKNKKDASCQKHLGKKEGGQRPEYFGKKQKGHQRPEHLESETETNVSTLATSCNVYLNSKTSLVKHVEVSYHTYDVRMHLETENLSTILRR